MDVEQRIVPPEAGPQPGTEEYKGVKEKLNREGFEGNAAVVVGSKGDADKTVQKLEEEGRAVDVRTYIHMHQETFASLDELQIAAENFDNEVSVNPSYGSEVLDNVKKFAPGTAIIYGQNGSEFYQVWYVGGDQSIKSLRFEPQKVATSKFNLGTVQGFVGELEELGFKVDMVNRHHWITSALDLLRQYRIRKAVAEKKAGFEF